jgi:hypothetical protein
MATRRLLAYSASLYADDRTYIGEITVRNQGCLYRRAQVYINVRR